MKKKKRTTDHSAETGHTSGSTLVVTQALGKAKHSKRKDGVSLEQKKHKHKKEKRKLDHVAHHHDKKTHAHRIQPDQLTSQVRDVLGYGARGVVYKGFFKGQQVAIKKVFAEPDESEQFASRQVAIMRELNRLDAPHVITLLAYTVDVLPYFLVMPIMSHGSLESHLDPASHKNPLSASIRFNVLMGVAKALAFMHAHLIIHCDVKPGNILLDNDFVPYVTDFDAAIQLNDAAGLVTNSNLGTLIYIAPEHFSNEGAYTMSTDVYAFSVTIWEVLAWRFAYDGLSALSHNKFIHAIATGRREVIPAEWSDHVRTLLEQGWHQDAALRPSMHSMIEELDHHKEEWSAAMRLG